MAFFPRQDVVPQPEEELQQGMADVVPSRPEVTSGLDGTRPCNFAIRVKHQTQIMISGLPLSVVLPTQLTATTSSSLLFKKPLSCVVILFLALMVEPHLHH
mmetsp:Transcript_26962/g.107904  ORF Transcript_26962/g.107904 Transcript_26962/m.107904 type:complete len:101 (-) Transcript_26962:536-838(-)